MPIIPNGYAQLNQVIALAGDTDEMITTIGLKFDGITFADVPTIMEAAFDAWELNFKGRMTADYSLMRIDSYSNFGGENLTYTTTQAAVQCQVAQNSAPQNCAYLLKKITGTGGRTGRGRMYVPGVSEEVVSATGVVTGSTVTAWNTAAAAYLTALNGIAGVDHAVLLHSQIGDLPMEITTIVCDSRIATQRRRLR